jgi:phosphoglycerate dehydrogenase-like enzyme
VLVSDPLHEGLGDRLAGARPDLSIRERAPADVTQADLDWADVFVGFRPPKTADWRKLPWVHCIGAGVDAWAFRTGISPRTLLTRTSEDFGPQMGEYCLSRALAVTQRLRRLETEQQAHRWRPRHPAQLRGTRAIIVGTGAVGAGIARAFAAAGCVVDGISRSGMPRGSFSRTWPMSEFAEAIAGAQWLVLACPLTEATFHFLDRNRLAVCGGAYLMNVGRGALVEEAALPEALDNSWISGAALDVFEVEPLPPESPLWDRSDVWISPHISGLTTVPGAAAGFLEVLNDLEAGRVPRLVVDLEKGY